MQLRFAFIIAVVFLFAGCAAQQPVAKSTTSEFRWRNGTNGFSLEQPKDTKLKRLVAHFPDGSSLEMEGYESTANAAAISAIESANQAQAATTERGIDAFKDGLRMGLEGYTGRKIDPAQPPLASGLRQPTQAVKPP